MVVCVHPFPWKIDGFARDVVAKLACNEALCLSLLFALYSFADNNDDDHTVSIEYTGTVWEQEWFAEFGFFFLLLI